VRSPRDAYRLAGNSAAHSPPVPGGRAATFGTWRDYLAMTGPLRGQLPDWHDKLNPAESEYHPGWRRKCGARFEPARTRERDGVRAKHRKAADGQRRTVRRRLLTVRRLSATDPA